MTGRSTPRARAPLPPLIVVLAAVLVASPAWAGFDPVRSRSAAVEEGNAKMKAGKADEALAAYDKAAAELPADPGVHFNRGTALAALSRFDEAAQEFLHATEAKDPSLKEAAFYNLGNAFFKKDKFKEAVEAYKRALALDPKDARAKWNLEIGLKKKQEDEKKKQQDKNKDDKNKDKDKDKDKKDSSDKKDDKQQDKDKDKQDQQKQSDKQDKKSEPPPPESSDKEDKPASDREIEQALDGLEKSPKDLEKQRARLRAVRRAPPTRDW